jgi:hypothetical protein
MLHALTFSSDTAAVRWIQKGTTAFIVANDSPLQYFLDDVSLYCHDMGY